MSYMPEKLNCVCFVTNYPFDMFRFDLKSMAVKEYVNTCSLQLEKKNYQLLIHTTFV